MSGSLPGCPCSFRLHSGPGGSRHRPARLAAPLPVRCELARNVLGARGRTVEAEVLEFQTGEAKRNESLAVLDTLRGTSDHQEQQQQET